MKFQCPACRERGWPAHFESEPKCGFLDDGLFTPDNWMCETLLRLRTRAGEEAGKCHYRDDQYLGVIPTFLGFIVLSWYKHRGRTEGAWIMDQTKMLPLNLAAARAVLEFEETMHPGY